MSCNNFSNDECNGVDICDTCHKQMFFYDLITHYCLEVKIECPICRYDISRKDLDSHMKSCCQVFHSKPLTILKTLRLRI